jgi:starvation-inducible DNA-binding protein
MSVLEDVRNELTDTLTECLANATVMYHQSHGYHWNVVGPDFPEWHEKFLEIYEDVYSSLDPIAENIRKVGGFPPFLLTDLSEAATIAQEAPKGNASAELVAALFSSNNEMLVCLNKTFRAAVAANQQGIANFIAERIDQHQKWAWQLKASM